MSKQQANNPYFKEGDEVSNKIEEGVAIQLEPHEFAAVDAVIRENQATMHAIKELSKELVRQEGDLWQTIHNFYPELKDYHCQVNFRDGIVIVGEPMKDAQRKFIDSYGYVAPPFSMQAGQINNAEGAVVPAPVQALFARLFGDDSQLDEED